MPPSMHAGESAGKLDFVNSHTSIKAMLKARGAGDLPIKRPAAKPFKKSMAMKARRATKRKAAIVPLAHRMAQPHMFKPLESGEDRNLRIKKRFLVSQKRATNDNKRQRFGEEGFDCEYE